MINFIKKNWFILLLLGLITLLLIVVCIGSNNMLSILIGGLAVLVAFIKDAINKILSLSKENKNVLNELELKNKEVKDAFKEIDNSVMSNDDVVNYHNSRRRSSKRD